MARLSERQLNKNSMTIRYRDEQINNKFYLITIGMIEKIV